MVKDAPVRSRVRRAVMHGLDVGQAGGVHVERRQEGEAVVVCNL